MSPIPASPALAHLIATQGDSVGLITMSDDVLDYSAAHNSTGFAVFATRRS